VTTGSSTARATPPPGRLASLKDHAKRLAHAGLSPIVRLLVTAGIGPDSLTALGCIFSVFSAVAFFEGAFRLGAGLLLMSGVCDILDGQVARTRQAVSRFGAFLDSTLDRFAEAFVLVGIGGYYMEHLLELIGDPGRVLSEMEHGLEPGTWARVSLIAALALVSSFMVSYTRARAEGLGLDGRVGWFERPERLLLIMIAGAFGNEHYFIMPGALLLLTILSFTTAGQRMVHVWKQTRTR
jgi:phosphatidylinositol phosphate synthase